MAPVNRKRISFTLNKKQTIMSYSNYGEVWSSKKFTPITPDDNNNLPIFPRGVYVSGGGDIVMRDADGDTVTFGNAQGGTIIPVSPTRVLATGTTATGLVALL